MLPKASAGESDIIEQELYALPEDLRSIIESEREVNQLRLDDVLRVAAVSVPSFRPENIQQFNAGRDTRFRSSSFQLADLLEMLPGQVNYAQPHFKSRSCGD